MEERGCSIPNILWLGGMQFYTEKGGSKMANKAKKSVKKFFCEGCGKGYIREKGLIKHQRSCQKWLATQMPEEEEKKIEEPTIEPEVAEEIEKVEETTEEVEEEKVAPLRFLDAVNKGRLLYLDGNRKPEGEIVTDVDGNTFKIKGVTYNDEGYFEFDVDTKQSLILIGFKVPNNFTIEMVWMLKNEATGKWNDIFTCECANSDRVPAIGVFPAKSGGEIYFKTDPGDKGPANIEISVGKWQRTFWMQEDGILSVRTDDPWRPSNEGSWEREGNVEMLSKPGHNVVIGACGQYSAGMKISLLCIYDHKLTEDEIKKNL